MSLSDQKGNVLFLILIAVALFAALSFAITQSTRTGDGDTSQEKMKLALSQIMQQATDLQTGLTRMSITQGVPLQDIQFLADPMDFTQGYCRTGAHCLFGSDGGGVVPTDIPVGVVDIDALAANGATPSDIEIMKKMSLIAGPNIASYDLGGSSQDDYFLLIWWPKKEFCDFINTEMHIPLIDYNNLTGPIKTPVQCTGVYPGAPAIVLTLIER